MIYLKTKDQINKMIDAGKILVSVHHALRDKVKEGVTTMELNDFVDDFIVSQGAYPEQKGYQGFPYAICASVNDEICHGFPSDDVILKDGDIISIDMVVNYKGWMADSCLSFAVGKLSEEDQNLFDHTREAMYKA
ncbi:MAG: M24 family metallopeptidase, partial [Fenollaria timonensis]